MSNLPFYFPKDPKETTVVVAMSGGVDSSTIAGLLHEMGYKVIGITLQLYDLGVTLEKKGACCAGIDIYDAKNVADKFGFPHYVLNYESIFKQAVMEDFADSYLRGETPIPCIKCNQTVKFADLLKTSKDLGADALVTGHYVRRIDGNNGAELHKALDHSKDQSYFLFSTTKPQLEYTYFPLGSIPKTETRKQAERLGLAIAKKPDSQDICFVPNGKYASVIEKLRPGAIDPGDIVTMDNKVIGKHNGIIHYTLGQRKGIGISSPDPLYVVKIDAANNRVIVGPESALGNTSFIIKELNWLADDIDRSKPIDVSVKVRSTHDSIKAKCYIMPDNKANITLEIPEKAVTPGQACVIYDNSRVLGGGWITSEIK